MSRLFFALRPDAGVRDELCAAAQKMQRDCGGRVTRRDNLHLTLVFVGNVDAGRMAELQSVAGTIAHDTFDFRLDRFGYWKHNRIVWAAPRTVPAPLRELAAALECALEKSHFAFDRRPYAPHLTLIRNAREPRALPMLDVSWRALEFVLLQSVRDDGGARYAAAAGWPLAPADRQSALPDDEQGNRRT